jgi:hypothetical protein
VEEPAGEADHDVVRGTGVFSFRPDEVAGGEQENKAEDIEDPGERADERRAEEDEAGPGEQREDDAEQQHLLLVGTRHLEAGHDDEEDEEVVDRQRLLGDVAGEILAAHLATAEDPHSDAERERDADVGRRPDRRFPQGRDVCGPDVEDEVEDQQPDDPDDRQPPDDGRHVHRNDSFRGPGVFTWSCGLLRMMSPLAPG